MKESLSAPRLAALVLVLGALGAGCSSDPSGDPGGGSPSASASSGGTDGLTYYRDAKPIIDVKCTGCHQDGGIAPFPLTNYAEVSAEKAAMSSAISSGEMPPWPPAAGCSDYRGVRALTDEQRATLTSWIDAGAPEGDPSAKPNEVTDDSVTLSRVDLTLSLPEAYTPQTSPDDYHCFIVDWPATTTTYVTGFGVKADTPSIVHHVIAYLATPDAVAGYQALDDAEPGPGYTCFGGPGGSSGLPGWLGGWAPGAVGADFPEGTGIEIPPGSKVVIQVHYNTLTAAPTPDRSSVLLKTDASVAKKAFVLPFLNPNWLSGAMQIPAHSTDTKHEFSYDPSAYLGILSNGVLTAGQPFTMHTASLHMHTRGTHAITDIERASGEDECLLDIEHWNFHWQGGYQFSEAKTFNPGDRLHLECHWDNPGDVDIGWGEGTQDEMCLGTYFVTE